MLCIPTLSAQSRGDKYVGGIIGITTTSISIDGSSASQTTFGFAPEFGYFASDRLRVGGSIGYQLISSDARADGRSQPRLLRQTVRPLLLHAATGRGIRVRIDGRDQRIRLRCRIVARSVRNQAVGPYRTLSQPSDVGLQLPVIFGNGCERGLFPARNQPDGRFQILLLGRKNPIPTYRNRTPRTRLRLRSAASRSTMPVTTSAASCQRLARKRRR